MSSPAPSPDIGRHLFEDVPGDIAVSFEFFPPRTAKMEEKA